MLTTYGFVTLEVQLATITCITLLVHIGISALFGLEEVRPIIAKARQLVHARVRIQ